MVHASLFSGIGGPECAARMMGWKNAFHCEINPFGRRILSYHFPESESYEDITKTDFKKWRGKINVLTGGFPCQPFSLAGRRKGADDDRYLWPQFIRVIREVKPDWVVGENVAGILTMVQPGEAVKLGCSSSLFGDGYEEEETRQQYVVETICRDLEQEGYSVQPFVIPACAVGAPHRRDRVFFIANRSDAGVEAVQQGWKNGVLPTGVITDTDSDRCRNRNDKQKLFEECKGTTNDSFGGKDGSVTYAKEQQGERHEPEQRGDCKQEQREFGGICGEDGGCEWECAGNFWERFPTTEPAVRRGDDGISERMDSIAFSKWRKESLKAYGNAIVPQVMYEIFRAIEIVENKVKNGNDSWRRRSTKIHGKEGE